MKGMKILIGGLVVVLVLLTTFSIVSSKQTDLYKMAPHVNFDQLFDDNEGTNYYYFYQKTCTHCNELKPDMTSFYKGLSKEEDFYLVDMKAKENEDSWYDWESHDAIYGENTPATLNPDYIDDPKEMTSLDKIEISGTPTLIITEDGVVTSYEVGNEEIKAKLGI